MNTCVSVFLLKRAVAQFGSVFSMSADIAYLTLEFPQLATDKTCTFSGQNIKRVRSEESSPTRYSTFDLLRLLTLQEQQSKFAFEFGDRT